MPKITRPTEVEVSQHELAVTLSEFAMKAKQGGAFLLNDDGSQRGEVVAGGYYLLRGYDETPVLDGTVVHIVAVVPEAGIVWGSYFNKDGQPQVSFFNPALLGEPFDVTIPEAE